MEGGGEAAWAEGKKKSGKFAGAIGIDLAGDGEQAGGVVAAGEDADGFIDFGDVVQEAEDVIEHAAEAGFGDMDAGGDVGELEDESALVVEGKAFGGFEDDGIEAGRSGIGERGSGGDSGVVEQPTGLADHGAEFAALMADVAVVVVFEGHFKVVGDGLDAAEGLADFVEESGEEIGCRDGGWAGEEFGMEVSGQRCSV